MPGNTVHVGWTDHSIIAFITSAVLARHKVASRSVRAVPHIIDSERIAETTACNSSETCYAVGTFNDRDVEGLLAKGCKLSVIGKLYGKKYGGLHKPVKIGTVKIYPVQRMRLYGLEYLSVLVTYFNLSDTPIFLRLSNMSLELAKVLTATDAWYDAFYLISSIETVSSHDDIDRVVEHIKRSKGYEEKYKALVDQVSNTIVESTKGYTIFDLRDPPVPAKKAKMVVKYVMNNKPAIFIVSAAPEGHDVMVLSKRTLGTADLLGLQKLFDSSQDSVYGNVAMFRSRIGDWTLLLERVRSAARMLVNRR